MSQYDAIAQDFTRILGLKLPLYRDAVYPGFAQLLGNVRGLDVLDLGSGQGELARDLVELGADVVAVDESAEQLRIAKSKDPSNTRITYVQKKVGEMGKIGSFHKIAGRFILHYSKTIEELEAMCLDVAVNLADGGTFCGANANPDCPLCVEPKYNNIVRARQPLCEGDPMEVIHMLPDRDVRFTICHWNRETYERSFRKAGLSVKWHPVYPTDEGVRTMGREWWQHFLDHPQMIMLSACKAAQSS